MAVTPTLLKNPDSGIVLKEQIDDQAMKPGNNLSDLKARVTALKNLTGNPTAGTTVTVTSVAAGANDSTITVTVTDANGVTVAAVHRLDLWFSALATGIGLTATAYSGSLVATTGALLTTLTAKKHFTLVTAATGIFAGTLTDSAKTADYCAVLRPYDASIVVSDAMVFG